MGWTGLYLLHKNFFYSRDRKGVLYSMYAVGAPGSAEHADKVKPYKKTMKLTSPVHKRTRILFDDILANAAKKGRKGSHKKGGRLLSIGKSFIHTKDTTF